MEEAESHRSGPDGGQGSLGSAGDAGPGLDRSLARLWRVLSPCRVAWLGNGEGPGFLPQSLGRGVQPEQEIGGTTRSPVEVAAQHPGRRPRGVQREGRRLMGQEHRAGLDVSLSLESH